MIKDHLAVMDGLKNYGSPKARLTRLLKAGELFQIRRGLFVDDLSVPKCTLAPLIYGPSYLSFQYALSFHGLIPERVARFTSASFKKNKDKVFHTRLGEYSYQYLPQNVYPYGIMSKTEKNMNFLIATPEKALCDSVYKMTSTVTVTDMNNLLLEDWRIERDDLLRLDLDFIFWIAPMYRRRSLVSLVEWFTKGGL